MERRADYDKFLRMTIEELLNDIRANRGDFFASTLARWLEKNAAFRLFIEGYKDKVRKKLNDCDNENKRRDLLWELEVAYLLSKSNDFGLEYERYGKNIARSPDYTVSQRLEVQFDARRHASARRKRRLG